MSYISFLENVLGTDLFESFKDFKSKFYKDNDKETVDSYVEKFKTLKTRNKITGKDADISLWIPKSFDEFKSYLDKFDMETIKSRNEIKKESYKNVVAENEEYVIIEIKNHDEIYALGKGTVWCIASGEKVDAEEHYDYYTKSSSFYVAIKKKLGSIEKREVNRQAVVGDGDSDGNKYSMIYPYWDKIAIQVQSNGEVIYWDTGDFNHEEGDGVVNGLGLPKYKFKYNFQIPSNWTLNKDDRYDVNGNVDITKGMLVDGKIPWKFGKVLGRFDCSYCTQLISLEGAPQEVGGNFGCHGCTSLVSLEGAPQEIGGDFRAMGCKSLVSLEGAPQEVSGDFVCLECENLKTLEGAPREVWGNFICYECNNLESLEGAPQHVGKSFDCSYCHKLKLSELEKIPLSYRNRVKHSMKESTFYFWDKKYQKLNG